MKYRRLTMVLGTVVALAVVALGARTLQAQQPGFKRVPLMQHDISIANHETVVARGEFSPGAATPRHTHPGDEVGFVLEGTVVMEMDGKPPATLKAGDVFFVPVGQVHAAKNAGTTPAKVISTYIVEKGKPLATPLPPAAPAKK
jgi:quercetin dioxygenase-like cupin family protein